MDRLIYTALTALRSSQAAQGVTANNLANANTLGFRRELANVATRWLGDDAPAGSGRAQADEIVRTAVADGGLLTPTGSATDIAVDGRGWIAVRTADGAEAYTRRGDLRVAAGGILETGEGDAVLGDDGPLTVPSGVALSIAVDGSITAGGIAAGRIKLVDAAPGVLAKRADGRFAAAAPLDADRQVRLRSGTLEGSNVGTAATLVELLEQSRSFEGVTRLLRVTREIDEGGARLMRLEN